MALINCNACFSNIDLIEEGGSFSQDLFWLVQWVPDNMLKVVWKCSVPQLSRWRVSLYLETPDKLSRVGSVILSQTKSHACTYKVMLEFEKFLALHDLFNALPEAEQQGMIDWLKSAFAYLHWKHGVIKTC